MLLSVKAAAFLETLPGQDEAGGGTVSVGDGLVGPKGILVWIITILMPYLFIYLYIYMFKVCYVFFFYFDFC